MPTRKLPTRYEDELKLFPDRWHKVGLAVLIPLLLTIPIWADARWLTVANLALVTVVGAAGMMVLTGFTGQISLGHAAFLALGAYAAAVLGEQLQVPFWLTMPAGGLLAALMGLLVGPFALRMQGLYLAIVTLGLLVLVDHVLLSLPSLTHGVSGIAVPMRAWFGDPGSLGTATELGSWTIQFEHKLYYLYLPITVVVTWTLKNLKRSNTGRAMAAVRDRDVAAAALGVHPARVKLVAFGLSSFFGGLAGAMFAYQQQYITVVPPFDLAMSVQYIAIVVLGGVGTVFGAVAGAVVYVVVEPLTGTVAAHVPGLQTLSSAQQSTLVFSLLVVAFLVFEPLGVVGIWLRLKRYFLAWPFRYG